MLCNGGRCACQASGRSCQETNECCAGLACQSNVCRPMADAGADVPRDGAGDATGDGPRDATADGGDGGACIAAAQTCAAGQRCCGDYSCAMQPGGTSTCCHNAGGSCGSQLECCGWQLCNIPTGQTRGTCQCRPAESSCITEADCCNGAACNRPMGAPMSTMGTCACRRELEACTATAGGDAGAGGSGCCSGLECRSGRCLLAGCTPPGETCGSGNDAGACCGGYECGMQPSGIERKCCRTPALTTTEPQTPCRNSLECCGTVLCDGGFCRCRTQSQSCIRNIDCCGRMLCDIPMGATMGTCRCQARGQLCLANGQDCCSGLTCRDGTCQ